MTDRIVLHNMVFMGRHGVLEQEQREAQPFHVDVELGLDLQPAGIDDDLTRTVDYGVVFETCRSIVESTSFRLIEALAEAIAHELLADFPIANVVVRVAIEGRSVDDFVKWAARETGRSVSYASAGAERSARDIVLKGSVAGLTPEAAVTAVLSTTSLQPSIDGGQIRIGATTP